MDCCYKFQNFGSSYFPQFFDFVNTNLSLEEMLSKEVLFRINLQSNRFGKYKCDRRYFRLHSLLFVNYPFYSLQNQNFLCKEVDFDILNRDIHFHIDK